MPNTINADNLCMGCMSPLESPNAPCLKCGFYLNDYEQNMHQLKPYTILGGKYLVGRVLGEGGFGITYLGWDLNLEIKIAIKEYYPSGLVTREITSTGVSTVTPFSGEKRDAYRNGLDKFVNEAKSLAKFYTLPGIVAVKDFFRENGTAYIVMEFVEGITIKQHLANNGGKLNPNEVLELVKPLMKSLSQIHASGVIHRDISPDNIMLTSNGDIKLIDFGAARDFVTGGNRSMSVLLKPGYAPEEQYRTKGNQGPWTDVYALCATMYKMITGITPPESLERYSSDELVPPSQMGIVLPEQVENALVKGLAVFQKDRFQSIDDLYEDIYGTNQEVKNKAINTDVQLEQEAAVKESSAAVEKAVETKYPEKVDVFSNHESQVKKGHDYMTVSFAALVAILAVQFAVFFTEIIISLKNFSPIRGLSGSSWAGIINFIEVFTSLASIKALLNTIIFNLLFSIIVFGIALAMGYIVILFSKGSIWRDILSVLFILLVFLPAEVYTNCLITLLSSEPFVRPDIMRFLHPLFSAIKYAGIPAMVLYILDEAREERDNLLPFKVSGLFALTSLAFITNGYFSLTNAIYNPSIYSTTDMIDTFIYRTGMQRMNMRVSSAMRILQAIFSSISFAVLFVPIKRLFTSTFKNVKSRISPENIKQKLISSVIAMVIFTIIYFVPFILNGSLSFGDIDFKTAIAVPMIYCLIISLFSALIATALALLIGWNFISQNKKIVFSSIIILSLVSIIGSSPVCPSQYIVIKNMGLFNTVFAIILTTCFSAAAVWAAACILKTESFISSKSLLFAAAGIFLIQAAVIYCNSTPFMVYSTNIRLSPALVFKRLMESAAETGFSGFILSLPPVLLFLAAKIILPKSYLVSVISGGMKS